MPRTSRTSTDTAAPNSIAGSGAAAPYVNGRSAAGSGSADSGRRAPAPGGTAHEVVGEPEDEASAVFDQSLIQTYEISVAPEDLARLDANPAAEEYAVGSVTFQGKTYAPIGFRYKGSAGAFVKPCTAATTPGAARGAKVGKCSIKLAFDEYTDDGRFFGLKKLNLHSMGRDVAMMREQLGYSLFREMQVAAPRTTYARVLINGQLEGLFLAVEQIDGRFTRSRFSDEGGKGNLYKEIWPLYADPAQYRQALESNKGPDTNVDTILAFAQSVQADPSAATAWVDRDYTLRYIAVDRVIMNDDGVFHWYCFVPQGNNRGLVGNHNYYWYEEERAGRLWLIPWDLDNAMGNEPRVFIDVAWSEPASCSCHVATGFPQRAPSCDALTAQLATWRPDYEKAVDRFLEGPFSEWAVAEKLDRWTAQIAPLVDETAGLKGSPDRATWQQALTELQQTLATTRKHRGYPYTPSVLE